MLSKVVDLLAHLRAAAVKTLEEPGRAGVVFGQVRFEPGSISKARPAHDAGVHFQGVLQILVQVEQPGSLARERAVGEAAGERRVLLAVLQQLLGRGENASALAESAFDLAFEERVIGMRLFQGKQLLVGESLHR
jgi:hypothetical protein